MSKVLDAQRFGVLNNRGLAAHLWAAVEDVALAEVTRLRGYADTLAENRSAEVWDKADFVRDFREWSEEASDV